MAKHYNTQNDSASLSAFFFYGHNVSFFRLPCPPLAKRGSLTHSQALALSKRARDVTALQVLSVRKPTRPSLPLRKAPPLTPALSPRREGGNRPTRCSEPLRYKVGGASKPSPGFAGWDRLTVAC